jgi:hypothetical protein
LERLSEWFEWTDAISLAAALTEGSGVEPSVWSAKDSTAMVAEEAARVRDILASSIHEEFGRPPGKKPLNGRPLPEFAVDTKADLAMWRRRYVAKQQSMEASIRAVRGRVRETVANLSPAMARIAALDEVMERVLGEQERTLLSIVPQWLERRFDRLTPSQRDTQVDDPRGAGDGDGWEALRHDMLGVLRAELDFRWQPVEGLLEALRSAQSNCSE